MSSSSNYVPRRMGVLWGNGMLTATVLKHLSFGPCNQQAGSILLGWEHMVPSCDYEWVGKERCWEGKKVGPISSKGYEMDFPGVAKGKGTPRTDTAGAHDKHLSCARSTVKEPQRSLQNKNLNMKSKCVLHGPGCQGNRHCKAPASLPMALPHIPQTAPTPYY